jgi:hypothetical protein
VCRIEALVVGTKEAGVEAKDEKTKYICVCHINRLQENITT